MYHLSLQGTTKSQMLMTLQIAQIYLSSSIVTGQVHYEDIGQRSPLQGSVYCVRLYSGYWANNEYVAGEDPKFLDEQFCSGRSKLL